jgi:hypothetical protein
MQMSIRSMRSGKKAEHIFKFQDRSAIPDLLQVDDIILLDDVNVVTASTQDTGVNTPANGKRKVAGSGRF